MSLNHYEEGVLREAVEVMLATGKRSVRTAIGRVYLAARPSKPGSGSRLELRVQHLHLSPHTVETPEGVRGVFMLEEKIYTVGLTMMRDPQPRLQRHAFMPTPTQEEIDGRTA